MDKLIQDQRGTTISNDGATIVKLLDVAHPAAKTLVDISVSQDNEVGDGTTSVCLLAGEFMKEAKEFIEDKMAPNTIIKGYREALKIVRNIKKYGIKGGKNQLFYHDIQVLCSIEHILMYE